MIIINGSIYTFIYLNLIVKALQLLRVVAHTDLGGWGSNKSALLKLYKSLARLKLDYDFFYIIMGQPRSLIFAALTLSSPGFKTYTWCIANLSAESHFVKANEALLLKSQAGEASTSILYKTFILPVHL